MNIIYLLVPLAILLGLGALFTCLWAIKTGQFDDTKTPAYRILLPDQDFQAGLQSSRSNQVKQKSENTEQE